MCNTKGSATDATMPHATEKTRWKFEDPEPRSQQTFQRAISAAGGGEGALGDESQPQPENEGRKQRRGRSSEAFSA